MRTATSAELTLLTAARVNHHARIEVKNGSGTWKDLTSLSGIDWVDAWEIDGEAIDRPIATAKLELRRDTTGTKSLAPLVAGSPLNVDDTAAYAPLLDIGRAVRITTAVTAAGVAPVSGDWKEMFLGRINAIDWESSPVVVDCSDSFAWVVDRAIESVGTFGSNSGASIESILQALLTAWPPFGGAPTLYTPVSPGWVIPSTFLSEKKSLAEMLKTLVDQIAWDLRYRYDASGVSRLTLFQPPRSKTVSDATLGPAMYRSVRKLHLAIDDVRNVVAVNFVTAAGAAGQTLSPNATSQAKFGRRYMEIPAGNNIHAITDAQALGDAAVSDLGSPKAEQEVDLLYYWPAQLYDLYSYLANADHYDSAQQLAVVGVKHAGRNGETVTTLTCRGSVAGAYAGWLTRVTTTPIGKNELIGFRYSGSVPGVSITYAWTLGALTSSVWAAYAVVAANALDPWPAVAAAVASLGSATSITIPWPSPGQITLLQVESRDANLVVGDVRRAAEPSVNDGRPAVVQTTVAGTVVTVLGNTNTQSIRIRDMSSGGTWESWIDCAGAPSVTVDLSLVGTNGVTGIAAGVTWPVEVDAYAQPKAYVVSGTPVDIKSLTVTNGTSTAPTWVAVNAAAPATSSSVAALTLQASAAPAGHTVRVWERHDVGSGFSAYANVTASLSPVPGTPPTSSTAYTYTTAYSATVGGAGSAQVTYQFKAEILNGSGVVVRTQTVIIAWYYT